MTNADDMDKRLEAGTADLDVGQTGVQAAARARILQDLGQSAQMVAAAKKEGGKVIVYTSMETFTADALKKAFEAKTGLQMEYWRGGSTEVLDRSLRRVSRRQTALRHRRHDRRPHARFGQRTRVYEI